eukprot:403333829
MRTTSLVLSISAIIALTAKAADIVTFQSSLADCNKLLNNFELTYYPDAASNTLTYPYDPVGQSEFEVVQCSNVGICPDNVERTTCLWERVFAAQCVQANLNAPVILKIATNSLPNHCYYGALQAPRGDESSYNVYRFDVGFNTAPIDMASARSLTPNDDFNNTYGESTTDLDLILCDYIWAKSNSIDQNIYYQEAIKGADKASLLTQIPQTISKNWKISPNTLPLAQLPESSIVVGIARNGVFIFAGVSELGYDAFFPKKFGRRTDIDEVEVDLCLGSLQTFRTYRYHSYSPCMYDGTTLRKAQQKLCKDSVECSGDGEDTSMWTYAAKHTNQAVRSVNPIGIARDGRVIYGPFKSTTELWQPCDVDICNGRYFTNYYGYVTTMFFPYTIGCWGPGSTAYKIAPQCSDNTRQCSAGNMMTQGFTALILLVSGIVYSVLF